MAGIETQHGAPIAIRRWLEVADRDRLTPELDAIFFESSATKSFASERERAAFRERWLGRYLTHDPEWAYVAIDAERTLAGYLVGSIDDPAHPAGDVAPPPDFAHLVAAYPAHLHVNLAPQYRDRGIGARLVATFAADAARAGAAGVHVITGGGSRNIGFYERNGFRELSRARVGGREVVFLGRQLGEAETA